MTLFHFSRYQVSKKLTALKIEYVMAKGKMIDEGKVFEVFT